MSIEWIAWEIFINIVEVGITFYLLCKKFPNKYRTFFPTLLFMIASIVYLSLPFVLPNNLPPVEIVVYIIFLLYVLLCRNGSIGKKIFWVTLACALLILIAISTITMFSLITGMASLDIIAQFTGTRILAAITSKIIHLVLFYILSMQKKKSELSNSPALIILFIVPLISFLAITIIFYIILNDINHTIPETIIYIVAVSSLLINIIIFVLYERIQKEAEKNYMLLAKQNQYELTEQHNNQIIQTYSTMREWRHDYINHMSLIMQFLKDSDITKAENYLENLDEKIKSSVATVSTGNYIVDAILSAKLAMAESFNITFEYNIFLPQELEITDTDLCSALSNLLDNAIEACRKLENGRYINLEMMVIKNQLHIGVVNSTNGEYKKESGIFKTTKQGGLHGIGMSNIKSIVEKYEGIYNITADDNSFTTKIAIPLTGE